MEEKPLDQNYVAQPKSLRVHWHKVDPRRILDTVLRGLFVTSGTGCPVINIPRWGPFGDNMLGRARVCQSIFPVLKPCNVGQEGVLYCRKQQIPSGVQLASFVCTHACWEWKLIEK
ncbi:hypothetical protein COLO4_34837 [Corchorus olitorius]|uniref:Uncharacterized protein n=1 Tax=Corchorus olitorius TaxID=93759 RepID=A0A1R3GJD4_9ROSI|nr:hypothetical protein COLO4_34837 [Corchorus olitorius]